MRQASEIHRALGKLQAEAIHDYEERLRCGRAQHELWAAWQRSREEERRREGIEVFARSGDREHREALQRRYRTEARELYRQLRSCARKHPNRRAAEASGREALKWARRVPGRTVVAASRAALLAGDGKSLAGNRGKKGNPWVLPSDPSLLFLQKQAMGSDWACAAQPYSPPATAVVWFSFFPDKSATWHFLFLANFAGTYGVMTSLGDQLSPSPTNWLVPFLAGLACAGSRVNLSVAVDVYQHGWHGSRTTTLIDVDTKTDNFMNLFNEKLQFDYQAPLVAYDLTLGKMEISLDAGARGYHYSASIDFANNGFIQPLLMMAWRV